MSHNVFVRSCVLTGMFFLLASTRTALANGMVQDMPQPTTHDVAQRAVDRLVHEPFRFEGASGFPLSFRQESGYSGQQPTRVLVGYHLTGDRIEGEFVALDVHDRPLQAAPVSGSMIRREGQSGLAPSPCVLDIALFKPLHLSGLCGATQLSGAYTETVQAQPLLFILPGLGRQVETAGTYMMLPWRE